MKIKKSELLKSLTKVLPGIETGNVSIEGADSIVFHKGHIYSYNSAISVDVDCRDLNIEAIVKGQEFYNCIGKLPNEDIDINVTEKALEITDEKIKVQIKLLKQDDAFEKFKTLEPTDDWTDIDGDDFAKALKTCRIARNVTNFAGIYFLKDTAISSNRCIINKYVLKNEYPTFWLSDKVVNELSKWNTFEKVQVNKGWIQFMTNDGTIFSARGLNLANFPYETIAGIVSTQAAQKPTFTLELTPQFYDALNRASEFSHSYEEYSVVDVEFGKEVKVESARDSGKYEEIVTGLSVDIPNPKKMAFDFKDFIASDKLFKTFKILADSPDFSTDVPVHCLLENDCAIKIFSSIK